MRNFKFRKQERVVSQKLIDELFGGGHSHSMAAFPLRAVYMKRERQEGQMPVEVLISVPKKHFKHAVDRNRVKRQLREAYRRQKQLLTETVSAGFSVVIAFVWLSDQHLCSTDVDRRMRSLLVRIGERVKGER